MSHLPRHSCLEFKNGFEEYRTQVTPNRLSHISERLKISGSGFKPNSNLTIQGKLVCPSEKFDFSSHAHIVTDSDGCFDLSTTASVGGSYTGIDGMGLLWSMVKNTGAERMHVNNGKLHFPYTFNVFENHIDEVTDYTSPLSQVSIERYIVNKSMIRRDVRVGRVRGTLYIPDGNGPFPGIISLHGGVKQKKPIEQDAAMLANEGFATLALPFYGVDDLPRLYTTQPIDIEYFEEAIDWFSSLDVVDSSGVGVIGQSKGGDVALAIAQFLPSVKSVCWINGNIASTMTDATYRGQVTSMLSLDYGRLGSNESGDLMINNLMDNPLDNPESIHRFEGSPGSFLFIVGQDDWSSNGSLYSDIAKQRMDAVGKTNYKILKYDGLGHCIDIPYAPVCTNAAHPLAPPGVTIFYGGSNRSLHSKQQLKVWRDVVDFFKYYLIKPYYSDIQKSKL